MRMVRKGNELLILLFFFVQKKKVLFHTKSVMLMVTPKYNRNEGYEVSKVVNGKSKWLYQRYSFENLNRKCKSFVLFYGYSKAYICRKLQFLRDDGRSLLSRVKLLIIEGEECRWRIYFICSVVKQFSREKHIWWANRFTASFYVEWKMRRLYC